MTNVRHRQESGSNKILVYLLDRAGMFTVVEVEVLCSNPQAVFGLTLDKNMIVVDMEKSGSAADAGIQAGDVLVAIIRSTSEVP
jgi:predicted metalloprotease with PDZ domain